MKKALPQNNQTNTAILLLVLSCMASAAASLLLRMAGTEAIGTFAKAFLRNFVVLLFSGATLYQKGIRPVVKRENYMLLLSRTVLGTISVLAGYYSIDHLILADATMLSLLGPLFTVVSSVFVLKEHTTRRQKQLLALAIVGMLLVVKPSWNFARLFPMLMGLLAAATVGYAFTLVRLMQLQGEDSGVLVFWFSLLSCLFMLPLALRDTFVFAWEPFLLVIGSGIAGSALQLFSTRAYGMAPAGTLSVYEYTQLPFAAVLGWLILSEVPSLSSFLGYLIIITVSVLVFRSGK